MKVWSLLSDEDLRARLPYERPCERRLGTALCGAPSYLLLSYLQGVSLSMGQAPVEEWPTQYHCLMGHTETYNRQPPLPAEPAPGAPERCVAHRDEKPCLRCSERAAKRRATTARRLALLPSPPASEPLVLLEVGA